MESCVSSEACMVWFGQDAGCQCCEAIGWERFLGRGCSCLSFLFTNAETFRESAFGQALNTLFLQRPEHLGFHGGFGLIVLALSIGLPDLVGICKAFFRLKLSRFFFITLPK